MRNHRFKVSIISVLTALLISSFGTAQAVALQNSTLSMDAGGNPTSTGQCSTGSCFGVEVAASFWVWTMLSPGADGGFVMGGDQQSGGQELAPSADITAAGGMSDAWFFFGAYGTFYGDNSLNVFSDTSNDGTTVLNDFNMAWNGESVALGNGKVNDYSIGLDATGAGKYSLDYTAVIGSGQFMDRNFRLITSGVVMPGTAAVPVPPAMLLFMSGLIGLRFFSRKKSAVTAS